MRAAPAIHVSVSRFGVWRAALAGGLVLVWAVVLAWLASQGLATGGMPAAKVIAFALLALTVATWFACSLATVRPFGLRWDGRCWHLRPDRADEPIAGDLVAALDFGDWLLLRFTPERPTTAKWPRWLPVQRRGLEPTWHPLRCAVHSPRPPAPGGLE